MENSAGIAMKVSRITILINLLLSVGKLAVGLIARSGAMVSDAVHSASDVFSTIVVMIGMKASGKDSDREHPYGHERMECVAAILLSGLLLGTGLFIGYEGVKKILSPEELPVPGALALAAAAVSILVKEGMYRYTRKAADQIQSDALRADAWHHRSDALSSVGALLGVGGARLGLTILDPIASIVICLMVAKAAYDIFRDAINKMVDESCDEETEAALRRCVLDHEGIDRIDLMRTRKFGNRVYVEIEVAMDGGLTLSEAHRRAEEIHADIEEAFPQIKHIMIHVNPTEEGAHPA